MRFPLEVTHRVRQAWGEEKPLFARLSATDWAEGPEQDSEGNWRHWGIQQTKILAQELIKAGVDLIDTSSGGNWLAQKIPVGPGYQVRYLNHLVW